MPRVAPTTWIALLRAINVGGNNPVPMAALREMFERLGHTQIATYIQSGNVVFRGGGDEAKIRGACEAALLSRFGKPIRAVIRPHAEIARLLKLSPFPKADPSRLMVVFCDAKPSPAAARRLDPKRSPPDEFQLIGRHLFIHCPNGFGRTKYTLDYIEKTLGTHASARNWRTVMTLAEMASAS